MSIDDPDHPGDKLLQLLRDNEIDLNVVEGLRLVVAFRKIKDPSDRRMRPLPSSRHSVLRLPSPYLRHYFPPSPTMARGPGASAPVEQDAW